MIRKLPKIVLRSLENVSPESQERLSFKPTVKLVLANKQSQTLSAHLKHHIKVRHNWHMEQIAIADQ